MMSTTIYTVSALVQEYLSADEALTVMMKVSSKPTRAKNVVV